MRIVLIGGAGFIGHNLARHCIAAGAEVHVIDSLQVNNLGAFTAQQSPNAPLYTRFIYERLDLLRELDVRLHVVDARDYHLLTQHINAIKPNVVVQLAAVAHANRANKDPYSTFDHSMRTLENALDASRSLGPHFIYFSSSMVYGNFSGAVAHEDQRCEPMGIYGALKLSGEHLVRAYHQVFGLPYTIIRPSALYGERCVSRRVGQAFIENALRGQDLTVNGDGEDQLDFTYIDDLVQGVMRAMVKKEAYNETFNITYGSARSINQMAEMVRAEFPATRINHQPRDGLMPERGTLSIEKARTMLGYEPKFPLETAFPLYIQWYKELKGRLGNLF